jgi:heptosyltransferase-3
VSRTRHRLIIHPGALGDVLQAVPALRALRREGPLTFAGQLRIARLLHGFGLVEAPVDFDGLGLEALFSEDPVAPAVSARFAAFDHVVSWFGARDATYAARLRSIAHHAVLAPPIPAEDSTLTVWQHLLATVSVTSPAEVAPLVIPESWRHEGQRALVGAGSDRSRPLLVVHPGAGGSWKLWPPDRLARLIEAVVARQGDTQVIVHQGPADRDAATRLARALEAEPLWLIEPDLPVLAAILAGAAAYLGGDSGVSHLAAAVGAPSVIVFPPSTRERWVPWSPTALALVMSDEPGEAGVEDAVISRLHAWRG